MSAQEQLFDALKAEQNEADVLIDKGMFFKVPKRSLLKYLSKNKERTFLISQPYLGTLDLITQIFLSINFDEEVLKESPLSESKKIVGQSVKKCAQVVAITMLNSHWKIRLFSSVLATYLLWRVTPSKLMELAVTINRMSNLGDFINSIRFMSVVRTTTPKLMEKKQENQQA